MNLNEIISARKCGRFEINATTVDGRSIDKIMESLGLQPLPDRLQEIDASKACEILKTILWKDLAFHSELIPEHQAAERASYLEKQFSAADTKYFTNGEWGNFHNKNGAAFCSLKQSTFDAGVLFIGEGYAVSIWVQDED